MPDDHVQVWRLNTDDGQSFLGRIVPAPLVTKLADAFGIAATITRAIVTSHGGRLDVASEEEVGTVFTMVLLLG